MRGYRGRVGAFELFAPDDEIADLIAGSAPARRVRKKAIARGMRTLLDDALDKARGGVTSLGEIQRVVRYRVIEGA